MGETRICNPKGTYKHGGSQPRKGVWELKNIGGERKEEIKMTGAL